MKTTEIAKMVRVQGSIGFSRNQDPEVQKDWLKKSILKLEYELHQPESMPTVVTQEFDWNLLISGNEYAYFSFEAFENSGIAGSIILTLKCSGGSLIWRDRFSKDDENLRRIFIELPERIAGSRESANPATLKPIRGKVLETSGECSLGGLTVLLEAKAEENESWKVVASATTDSSGNFSMPYPFGNYQFAQAVVSIAPDQPVEVATLDLADNENQTISNRFLYLMLYEVGQDTTSDLKFQVPAFPMQSYSPGLCVFV